MHNVTIHLVSQNIIISQCLHLKGLNNRNVALKFTLEQKAIHLCYHFRVSLNKKMSL